MATIYDVARKANVSAAAVSLVLNNLSTSRVGAVKKKQILAAATALDYSPSGAAKALSIGKTRIVGLVVPMRDPIFFNHFIAEVLSGIQECLVEREYHLMIYSHYSAKGRITQSELAHGRFIDGLIVLNTRMCSQHDISSTISDLRSSGIPFVMMNCYAGDDQINYVGVDDKAIGRLGAKYLLSKGHQRIAMLAGAAKSPMTNRLLEGVKEAFKEAKLKFNSKRDFIASEYDSDKVRSSTQSWLRKPSPPTAIFCADDQLVPDVYAAVRAEKKQIPKDIAILGRGNLGVIANLVPPVTTVNVSALQMGRQAAELLLNHLRDRSSLPTRITIPGELIERKSV
jgi:LacI family transcriptional regulator